MLDDALVQEANRQFTICNACRYCEGICSVFPAMELKTGFLSGDISYLANLCHDCRACVPACPFTAPHEYAVDIPAVMSEVRLRTFESHARPQRLWRVVTRARTVGGLLVAGIVFALLVALASGSPRGIVETHTGDGAFYDVIAWLWLVVPAGILSLLAASAIGAGVVEFARDMPGGGRRLLSVAANRRALVDALGLRNLHGGGGDCHTVDELHPSSARRRLHHLVFYGFGAMFAATLAAAFEQDILGMQPPYPVLSVPVVLGLAGGIATTTGALGFMVVAHRRRRAGTALSESRRFDVVFTVTLLLATVTGLLTLALRSTPAMGPMLIVHFGTIGGFFLTLPYSKFVHGAYRYLALVRSYAEVEDGDEPHREWESIPVAPFPGTASPLRCPTRVRS